MSVGQSTSTTLPIMYKISGVRATRKCSWSRYVCYFYNDLPSTLFSAKMLLFADDAKYFLPISSLQDSMNLQSDLSHLTEWCMAYAIE